MCFDYSAFYLKVLKILAIQRPQQQQIFIEPTPSLDINMFKKPKDNRRIYAGKKKNGSQMEQKVPKLYDICIRLLLNNIDGLFF